MNDAARVEVAASWVEMGVALQNGGSSSGESKSGPMRLC